MAVHIDSKLTINIHRQYKYIILSTDHEFFISK